MLLCYSLSAYCVLWGLVRGSKVVLVVVVVCCSEPTQLTPPHHPRHHASTICPAGPGSCRCLFITSLFDTTLAALAQSSSHTICPTPLYPPSPPLDAVALGPP